MNEDLTPDDVMYFINDYAAEFESLEFELREKLISKFNIEIGRRYLDVAYSTKEWLRTCNRFAWCDEVLSDLVHKTLEGESFIKNENGSYSIKKEPKIVAEDYIRTATGSC